MATKTSTSKITTDHEEIKKWVEKKGGKPAIVESTETDDEENAGVIRIKFTDEKGTLDETDWDTFFKTFEEKNLAFLYQDKTKDNKESRFFKFVKR